MAQKKGIDFRKGKCAPECRKAEVREEGGKKGKKREKVYQAVI